MNKASYSFMLGVFILFSFQIQEIQSEGIAKGGKAVHSPAGGNYLSLDGEDDYAVLDFNKSGVLLKEGTREFTIEAWVYPTEAPPKDREAVVLSQQISMYTVGEDNLKFKGFVRKKGELLLWVHAYVASKGNAWGHTGISISLALNNWHHIVFQVQDDKIILICDNSSNWINGGIILEHNIPKIGALEKNDFVVGGFGCRERPGNPKAFPWGSFAGYIDELRVSKIPRYDIEKDQLIPAGRFDNDPDTVALWHFDETDGSEIFRDSSGNGYHLTGKNGAAIVASMAVDRLNKLAFTWAGVRAY